VSYLKLDIQKINQYWLSLMELSLLASLLEISEVIQKAFSLIEDKMKSNRIEVDFNLEIKCKIMMHENEFMQGVLRWFSFDHPFYWFVFGIMIVFFTYFYTAIAFDPNQVSQQMKQHGGFIPGIRPGKHTKEYIDKVLSRITFWGALYVSAVCVLPMILINKLHVPFYFGGTALLIVVGVAIDTMSQIQSYLISQQYEGLLRKARIKGRI
jgi:preprotein translocase subunit SecY